VRTSTAGDVGVLWLATLQRALDGASHDVKDALNGVSVNLEVIRARAAKPEAPAGAVAQFAGVAAQQLERLTTLLEAVLALGRAEREPADVGVILRRVATVCGASSSDATIEVVSGGVDTATTRVGGDAVRLALAAPLLEAVARSDRSCPASAVRCTSSIEEGTIVVTIRAEHRRTTMPESVADALRAAGVRWTEGERGDDLSLVFPRA
jgi:hypothetical protein